uniref:Uncharacterized protein n=1 Tax=Pseudomonas aeruginosa TaxID=287 RepID=A0A1V1H2W6_PSEAI|nr:hypothetical protein [Pseudomonas aeruginosa]
MDYPCVILLRVVLARGQKSFPVGPVVREPDRASAVRSRQRPDIKAPWTEPEPGSDAGLFVVPAPRQCLTRRSERTDTNVRTQAQH